MAVLVKEFSRRQFLAAIAAGGALIAGELWVPGAKTIFIPGDQRIWTFAGSLKSRQYGYNELADYSWVQHVRYTPAGQQWIKMLRISGDLTRTAYQRGHLDAMLDLAFHKAIR